MDKKMIVIAKKYGTDSFEYFKAGCDIFDREDLLKKLFETTKEVIELQKENQEFKEHWVNLIGENLLMNEIQKLEKRIDKAIDLIKEVGCYDEETKTFCDDIWEELPELLNTLTGGDE